MIENMKRTIGDMPIIGNLARKAYRSALGRSAFGRGAEPAFKTSDQYWNERYELGGNSGAGSYNRLAHHKAEIINRFVNDHRVHSVIEFGCGDGAQLALGEYPAYTGIDVSPIAVDLCKTAYAGDQTKTFYSLDLLPAGLRADLAMSLDVIYHLVEDPTFEGYMKSLFDAADRYVVVYSSNENKPWTAPHVRHRKFTDWVSANRGNWVLLEKIPNAYPWDERQPETTSFADFYFFRKNA